MSRTLKRVIYAIEEWNGYEWAMSGVYFMGDKAATRAKKSCQFRPDVKRCAAYDRDAAIIHPGRCLWMVEKYIGGEWQCERVCETLDDCRRHRAFITDRPTRELRFVRRKERGY